MLSPASIAILLGILAAISYGVADFFGAKASKDSDAYTAAFCVTLVGAIGYGFWYAAQSSALPAIDPTGVWYAIPAGALVAGGLACLYRAFAIGPVSLASPLGAAYPLVAALVGLFVFEASLSTAQIMGVVMVVAGVMIASGLLSANKLNRKISRGPAFALLASLMWGIGYPLLYQSVDHIGWQHATMFQYVITTLALGLIVLATTAVRNGSLDRIKSLLKNQVVLSAGAIQLIAILAINIGLSYENASGALVASASAMYPAITMLLALRHFQEQVQAIPLAGAGVSILGVIALSAS